MLLVGIFYFIRNPVVSNNPPVNKQDKFSKIWYEEAGFYLFCYFILSPGKSR